MFDNTHTSTNCNNKYDKFNSYSIRPQTKKAREKTVSYIPNSNLSSFIPKKRLRIIKYALNKASTYVPTSLCISSL